MSRKESFLPGEVLFKYYFETMGSARSLAVLREWCSANGIINPETGNPPTRMGIWKAMWSWALKPENLQTAKEIYIDSVFAEEGQVTAELDWNIAIKSYAHGGVELGKKKYKRFQEAIQ